MKKFFMIVGILLSLSQLTYADLAWENYMKNPSDENAQKVKNVNRSKRWAEYIDGISILEKQVSKGSYASLELAIRLEITKSGLDGESAERVPEIISYGVKVNPKGYLKALEKLGVKECLHIEPMGEEYVDGYNSQKKLDELEEKYTKFKALKKSPLQEKCTKVLASSIKSLKTQLNHLLIGVIEEEQSQYSKDLYTHVLFQKKGENFIVLEHISQEPLKWYIAFDGKYLGTVVDDEVYKIKNRTKGFTGWIQTPTYRPVVIVSKKNYKDLEKWKPFKPKRDVIHRLFPLFKKRVTKINYAEQDVKLFKSYKNNKNERLVQLGFDVKDLSSEGKSDEWFYNYWYYVTDNEFRLIGTNLELVDAGDYDNNGQSEVLFWKSDYNRDGYVLFYDAFTKSVVKSWSYH